MLCQKRFRRRQGRGIVNPADVAGEEETGTQRIQNMKQVAMSIGIMGQRQVTPRWENDPVWMHNGSIQESGQGRGQATPPYRNQAKGR